MRRLHAWQGYPGCWPAVARTGRSGRVGRLQVVCWHGFAGLGPMWQRGAHPDAAEPLFTYLRIGPLELRLWRERLR